MQISRSNDRSMSYNSDARSSNSPIKENPNAVYKNFPKSLEENCIDLQRDYYICNICNEKIGHFDTMIRHYIKAHPKFIKRDLYIFMSKYQYMLCLAKVQINLFLGNYEKADDTYEKELNNVMLDMIFRNKTVKLIMDYEKGEYKKNDSIGYCPIAVNIIKDYIKKYIEYLKLFYKCVNEIDFKFPTSEIPLNTLNMEDIKNFFSLDNTKYNDSFRSIFFIVKNDLNKNSSEIKEKNIEKKFEENLNQKIKEKSNIKLNNKTLDESLDDFYLYDDSYVDKKIKQKKDSGKRSNIKKTNKEINEISNYKTKNSIRTPTKYPSKKNYEKKIKENKNNTKEIYFENETYIHLLDSENTECGINESQFFQGERKSEISAIKNEQSLDGENYYKTTKKEKKNSIEKYEEKKSSEIDVPKDTSYLYNNLKDKIDPSKFIYIGNKNTGERNIQILPNLRNNDIRNIDNFFGSNEKSYMGKKRQNSQNIEQVENTIKEGYIIDDRNSSSKEKGQNVNMNIKQNDHPQKKFTIIEQNKKANNFKTNIVFEIGDQKERSKEKSNNEDHHLNEKLKQNENKDVNAMNSQKVNEVIKEDVQKVKTINFTEKKNSKKNCNFNKPE